MIQEEFKSEVKGIARECLLDIGVLSKVLFPEDFERDFTPLHLQIIEKFNSQIYDLFKGILPKPVVISAPRGLGKTSLTISVVAHSILFDLTPFIIYVSSSADTAEEHTEDIKNRLMESERVRKIFGDISIDRGERYGIEGSFSKKSWVAYGRNLVLPRGAGQRVRGRLFRGKRPGLIIIDDFEDEIEVKNEVIRKSNKQWLLGTLLKCVDKGRRDWRIIYIDTLKHQDSVMVDLLEMETWDSLKLSSCDKDLNSFIPEFISTEELKRELEEHRKTNTLPQFYMERMGEPMAGDESSFQSSQFRYYNETDLEFKRTIEPELENLVLYDPAKTTNPKSAWTAVVGVGFHAKLGSIYVREIAAGMMHPEEQYNEVFGMAQRLKARVIGLEVTGLNEFITYPFRTAMLQRGLNYEIIELKARKGEGEFSTGGRGKEGRIASLIPFYRKGQVFHNSANCVLLETQLLSYPLSKRWDVMDAFAYVVEILEMGLRYFEAEDGPVLETAEEIEREFSENSSYREEDFEDIGISLESF
jgi:hypothetical protein